MTNERSDDASPLPVAPSDVQMTSYLLARAESVQMWCPPGRLSQPRAGVPREHVLMACTWEICGAVSDFLTAYRRLGQRFEFSGGL